MAENGELSEREREILKLVATGASNKEIARKLYISTNTVKVHLRNIFAKIGVSSRTEAAMYAVQSGYVIGYHELNYKVGDNKETVATPRYRYNVWGVTAGIVAALIVTISILLANRNSNSASTSEVATNQLPRWESRKSMPSARFGMATAVYDNQIYVIAGANEFGITGAVERYDPSLDIWVTLTNKRTPVVDVQAVVLGGDIYVPGGRVVSDVIINLMEIYDTRSGEWRRGANVPINVSAYALATYEGRMYLFGGWDGNSFIDKVFEYDPGRDEWKEKTSMLYPRGYSRAVTLDGYIYIMGGKNHETILDSNHSYSPEAEGGNGIVWEVHAPIPQSIYSMGITNIADKIFLLGGVGKRDQRLVDLVYEAASNNWQVGEDQQFENLSNLSLVTVGSSIYAIGGEVEKLPISETWVYQPFYTILFPIVK